MTKSETDREALKNAAHTLNEHRTGVLLTGEVVDGKVILDAASLSSIEEEFADAKFSFVAVNAPFDPSVCPVK